MHSHHSRMTPPRAPLACPQVVAVAPGRQGRGLGSAMVRRLGEMADAQGACLYLEASSNAARRLYARLGFEEREVLQHRQGAPALWVMVRRPGQGAGQGAGAGAGQAAAEGAGGQG
jgi:GNAT superfamily N-acetyltransferase